MVRIFLVFLLIGIAVTQYQLFAGRGSWIRLKELTESVAEQRRLNERLRAKNEELAAEIFSLENRKDAIEERARHDLLMVREGELFFRIETAEELAASEVSEDLPDYQNPKIKPGSRQTFDAKRSNLYHAPKGLSAPKSRDRRQ